ncbi:hypothetical protein [Azospirillum sp. sgz302134]
MPRYVDMTTLGSVEAARVFLSSEGWVDSRQPGHWAVRFTVDRLLVLDLARGHGDILRATGSGLQRVLCYDFDAARIISEPAIPEPGFLYDPGETAPQGVYDWSADADYIARVVRSLAGASDPRLEELIAWLELHRDDVTGQVSATGADPVKAFEALRSGEFAARLSTDKAVMEAYFSAVRDDPAVARVVADAAAQAAARDRESVFAALRSELAADLQAEKERQDDELKQRERELQKALEQRVSARGAALERELKDRLAALAQETEAQTAARNEALTAEIAALTKDRDSILAERDGLQAEAARLADDISGLLERRRLAEDEVSRLSSTIMAMTQRVEVPTRALVHLPGTNDNRGAVLTVERLAAEILRTALLTPNGKVLMERFAALLLSGELPVLEGAQADDFALMAEALMAAGRLVVFNADETILTPEDLWSRPGSGIASPIAQASQRAQDGEETFLVQLRGIERSAARAWYPALAAHARRGLLPRRLLLFATVINSESEEAQALPHDAYRMNIEGAVVPNASLVAPSLLGFGPASVAFQLDPGKRLEDLSPALPVFPELGVDISLAMSLRVARVTMETLRLRPGDHTTALTAAKEFCNATGHGRSPENGVKGERKNA